MKNNNNSLDLPDIPESFIYNRSDRINKIKNYRTRSFALSKNKGKRFSIILLDVIFLSIMIILVKQFLMPVAESSSIKRYNFKLQVEILDEANLAKLIITNKSIFPRLKSKEVVVRFTFPGEGDSIRLTSVLPSQPGGRVVLPVLFYSSNLENELSVRIFVENRNIVLSAIGMNKI